MEKLKIILYISLWVIIWGTVASLLDLYIFLNNNIYSEGDFGQYLTFSVTAMFSIFVAKFIYSK